MTGALSLRACVCAVSFSLGTLFCQRDASAAVMISFSNGDSFDGDMIGDMAGPFFDAGSGVTGTITTTLLPLGRQLNSTSGQIGISSGTNGSAFDSAEFWGFTWDVDATFQHVDFSSFSTATESFQIQSDTWIGQSFSPTDSDITFNDGTGAFSFGSGDSSDNFNLLDLNNGNPIPLAAGSEIVFKFAGDGTDFARITGMTFGLSATTVPEPGAMAMFVVLGLTAGFYRHRRRSSS